MCKKKKIEMQRKEKLMVGKMSECVGILETKEKVDGKI